mmetsp:Transcript_35694/g.91119  ORF Transcript_35694/g.91119 Transcript_35694/m.91119 type:complete len:200 (+) Transcript_35694:311-910(+)
MTRFAVPTVAVLLLHPPPHQLVVADLQPLHRQPLQAVPLEVGRGVRNPHFHHPSRQQAVVRRKLPHPFICVAQRVALVEGRKVVVVAPYSRCAVPRFTAPVLQRQRARGRRPLQLREYHFHGHEREEGLQVLTGLALGADAAKAVARDVHLLAVLEFGTAAACPKSPTPTPTPQQGDATLDRSCRHRERARPRPPRSGK